jgi:hypothetical protein
MLLTASEPISISREGEPVISYLHNRISGPDGRHKSGRTHPEKHKLAEAPALWLETELKSEL